MDATADVVVASLLGGLSLVLFAWLGNSAEGGAVGRLNIGDHKLDFTKSFATNVGFVTGVVSAAIGAKILPAASEVTSTTASAATSTATNTSTATSSVPPHVLISSSGYTSLSILFLLLLGVAPFAYKALQAVVPPAKSQHGAAAGKSHATADGSGHGGGWAFLFACFLTLWGVIGELVIVGLIFYEARYDQSPSQPAVALSAVIPVWVVIAAALIMLYGYAVGTIRTIIHRSGPEGHVRKQERAHKPLAAEEETGPQWTVL